MSIFTTDACSFNRKCKKESFNTTSFQNCTSSIDELASTQTPPLYTDNGLEYSNDTDTTNSYNCSEYGFVGKYCDGEWLKKPWIAKTSIFVFITFSRMRLEIRSAKSQNSWWRRCPDTQLAQLGIHRFQLQKQTFSSQECF